MPPWICLKAQTGKLDLFVSVRHRLVYINRNVVHMMGRRLYDGTQRIHRKRGVGWGGVGGGGEMKYTAN